MQRVTGLSDEQVHLYELQIEAVIRVQLQMVMDRIADHIASIQTASALVLVAAEQPPADSVPAGDGLPPGQPYVSPDDLAEIPPLWQEAVAQAVLPIAAEVFQAASGAVHAQMVDAVGHALPSVGSIAAEQYLAQARNTFDDIGNDLWETARNELLDGFERGESIPQLAERLRSSAGMTAKTATLVGRTKVIEASNAGSIATARASMLDMVKEWIATPDPRTRPTHLAADGQRVALNEKFYVGGYAADFPADPDLPPAEAYNCRCAVGYVIPDEQPDIIPGGPPGTTTIDRAIAEQGIAPPDGTTTVERALEAQPLPRLPGTDVDLGELVEASTIVRPVLARAKTERDLQAAWRAEFNRIAGRDVLIQMPPNASLKTMSQYAEGTLQALERFPEAKIGEISWWSAPGKAYAQVTPGGRYGSTLQFNAWWASNDNRAKLLRAMRGDTAGWNQFPGRSSWSVRNATNPTSTAYHEFAHVLDLENLGGRVGPQALAVVRRNAIREGVDEDALVSRDISIYAGSDVNEMIAEAFTDVMVNGPRASLVSREIYDLMVVEYRRGGFAIRSAPIDDIAEEAARAFPRLPSPRTFDERLRDAQSGDSVRNLPPVKVFVDASAGADTGKWKAIEVTGLAGNPASLLRAVTSRVRVSGMANQRLRTPEGRPLADWEIKMRAGYTPERRAQLEAADAERLAKDIAAGDREIRALDKAMEQSPLPSDVVLWRGARFSDIGLPEGDAVGFEWTDLGYVGTSTTREISQSFLGGDPVLMRILVPERTPGIRISGGGENEILLARNLRFRVAGESRTANGVRVLDVEIVPDVVAPPVARAIAVPASRLNSMTVAQLRALVGERGVTIPTGARKADLVRLLDEGDAATRERIARATAQSTIGETRRGPTQLEIALGEREAPSIFQANDFGDHDFRGPNGVILHRGQPLPEDFKSPRADIYQGKFATRPGLTAEESRALDLYVLSDVADPLNRSLRAGRALETVKQATLGDIDLDDIARQLDSAISGGSLATDTNLYRGAVMRPFDVGKLQPGAVFTEKGFLSTSTERGRAFSIINWRKGKPGFENRSPVLFKILAPRGTPAAVAHVAEREVLLGRGWNMRVIRVDRPARQGDTRIITVELVPGAAPRGALSGVLDSAADVSTAVVAKPVASATSKLTVTALRKLAKERGIDVPAGIRKADLVKLIDETPQLTLPVIRVAPVQGDDALRSLAIRDNDTLDELVSTQHGEAIADYQVNGYQFVNAALRFTRGDLAKVTDAVPPGTRGIIPAQYSRRRVLDQVHGIDAAMEVSRTTRPILVHRGVDRLDDVLGRKVTSRSLVGQEWTDHSYVSTTSAGRASGEFTGNRTGAEIRITVPDDVGAIGIENIRPGLRGEAEILLQRGLKFRVTGDRVVNGLRTIDVEVVPKGLRVAPELTPAQLQRAAARARNAQIESSAGTARLLAEVDEIIAKGANRTALRQTLDDALIAPEQLFAGADPAVLDALKTALATGDMAKLKAAVTRLSTKAKIKVVGGKAGAKVKYDPDTMEGVGGIDIPAGAQVTVVRRGSTVTMPDGEVVTLEKARVTPVAPKPVKAAPKPRQPFVSINRDVSIPGAKPPSVAGDIIDDRLPGKIVASAEKYPSARDSQLAAIANRQGFDRLPTVVTAEQLDLLYEQGAPRLLRGFQGVEGKSALQMVEDMRSGQYIAGRGVSGNGYYFAPPNNRSGGFFTRAENFGKGKEGALVRATLHPEARLVTYDDIRVEFEKYWEDKGVNPAVGISAYGRGAEDLVLSDLGRFAASRGYDVIWISNNREWVVLNRSVLVVEDVP